MGTTQKEADKKMRLGRLEKIDRRDFWRTEDQDFTPWLAQEENIELLADTLGLELEIEAQEKEVGPFRADILCKDLGNGSWVLIENQLERTDHTHLGQLITYAAGLKAVNIIWIAATFTDEHRAALDWLNTVTDDDFRFFALEVELWRIGESLIAPKFNIVSKPNEWSKHVGTATRRIENEPLTETKQMQLAFQKELHDKLQTYPKIQPQQPHWATLSIVRSGIQLVVNLNSRKKCIGVGLYMINKNALAYFRELETDKAEIEEALGFTPVWDPLPGKKACRILFQKTSSPLDHKDRWPEYRQWIKEHLEGFDRVFRPRVKRLNPEKFQNQTDGEEEALDE